ncbi:RNA-binding domain-containing protein [Mycena polygramma]|nr:RNA-binding domain-containing protein [Mycena polygramma]
MPRILFVSGFHPSTRARALAYEFERFGPLIRCDVPAPRNPHAATNPYAFVEFRSQRDAEDAYYDMHGKTFEGSRLSIQWAKSPPSSVWRYDRAPPRSSRDRDRSRSPRRRSERDDRDRDRDRNRDRERDRDVEDREPVRDRDTRRRRSRSPDRRRSRTPERRRSASPDRKREDPDDRARTPARTPPPVREDEEVKREEDRAQTPP